MYVCRKNDLMSLYLVHGYRDWPAGGVPQAPQAPWRQPQAPQPSWRQPQAPQAHRPQHAGSIPAWNENVESVLGDAEAVAAAGRSGDSATGQFRDGGIIDTMLAEVDEEAPVEEGIEDTDVFTEWSSAARAGIEPPTTQTNIYLQGVAPPEQDDAENEVDPSEAHPILQSCNRLMTSLEKAEADVEGLEADLEDADSTTVPLDGIHVDRKHRQF